MTLRSVTFRIAALLVLVVAVGLSASLSGASPDGSSGDKPQFTSDGKLMQPTGYRQWVFVGTPVTPNDMNPPEAAFPEFHNVYIHPADFAVFSKTGKFPDGTVFIKELVSVGTKKAASGNGYFQGEFIGLEAAVKDSKRFAKEPGYWAYFSFGHKYPLAKAASKQPVASCNTCHQESAAEDYVFTQYYPVLSAAKPQ